MRVLAIGAHPDDIEIYCAGTIAKHINRGDECYFLVLTEGGKGGNKKVRKQEARKSAKILKIKQIFFGNFKDTRLKFEPNLVMKIREVVDKVKPDRIYTHTPRDYYPDHKAIGEATIIAARKVNEILFYEGSPCSRFFPNYFVGITSFMDIKKKVILTFESQNKKDFYDVDWIWVYARYNGMRSNFKLKYAEVFEVYKMIV